MSFVFDSSTFFRRLPFFCGSSVAHEDRRLLFVGLSHIFVVICPPLLYILSPHHGRKSPVGVLLFIIGYCFWRRDGMG